MFFLLLGVLLSLFCGFVGVPSRVFTPLVAEVALFLFLLLGLFDGVLLGYLFQTGQFALVLLFLLDAVLNFLLAFAFGLFTSLGLTLELLEVLFLGTLLSLALLVGELLLAGVAADGGMAAVVAGLDLLALSLLTGFLLSLNACLFGSLGLDRKSVV